MTSHLHTSLWVNAHIRQCFINNIPAFVLARGDKERGGILLKVNQFSAGVRLLQPIASMGNERVWAYVNGVESIEDAAADAIVQKKRSMDPDLWVIEIEDVNGLYDLGEPIEG